MLRKIVAEVFVLTFVVAWMPNLCLYRITDAYTADIVVPDQYSTIQTAVNNANDGDTILVRSGTYFEHVVVNTTVALIGEDKDTVIIDGGWTGVVVNITRNDVIMMGFTVRRSGTGGNLGDYPPRRTAGVYLKNVTDCRIFENKVVETYVGIQLEHGANRNIIANNTLKNNTWAGIGTHEACWNSFLSNEVTANLDSIIISVKSDHNTFSENIITASNWGFTIDDQCCNNTISGNHITNSSIGIFVPESGGNMVYHNDFANNTSQASCTWHSVCYSNTWDDGYPSGGNYWSDHNPPDDDRDKIGDLPYKIDENNTDRYPLVYPFEFYEPEYVCSPDLNKDGTVNIIDIAIVAKAFDCKPGDLNWYPIADMDMSEIINIVDVTKVAKDYGKAI